MSTGYGMVGFEKAQPLMALGEAHGWTMRLNLDHWARLVMERGEQRLEVNWRSDDGKLCATRRYTSPTRNTKSFSLAQALRIIAYSGSDW